MTTTELPKHYSPASTETLTYERWESSGHFNPDTTDGTEGRFSMILPPPNVTGTLHVGHALTVTIEDIMVRYARMTGKRTLWVPGTDHAAIATQSKVEAMLYKESKQTRHDLGREAFLERVTSFAKESQDTILTQLRRMGCSLDWSRQAYTLDEQRNLAVRTAFTKMYELGLIYRGRRIVNWDPKLQTNVSDDEVEWLEQTTPFYYLQYGPFVIATARPETKFGDKYVVVHPDDERYAAYEHGQKIDLEWINGPITATVIKDSVIDMSFGTGAMTITPWHDATDFEIAERHDLDAEQIIDERGLLLPIAGEFAGNHIKKARADIVQKLQDKGLVVKIDEQYANRIATNSRGGGTIEPQIREQWFVGVDREFPLSESHIDGIASGSTTTLKTLMQHVIRSGQIHIVPDHFAKTYFHWIDNLRDWCISRQLWYGHRIPAWYRSTDAHGEPQIYVGMDAPDGDDWVQDSDTLDTWFSSGLWTFSTLGWPEQSADLDTYHPLDVMETGYDILFFWVARMVLMTGCLIGQIPFKTVYLHGLIRDAERQKMSKTKGNVIDPLTMSDMYGTDALRMALVFSTAAGSDIPLAEDKIKGMKHFANKVWNIARYTLARVPGETFTNVSRPKPVTDADTAILQQLDDVTSSVTESLDRYALHAAAQRIYQFTWHELADIYLEASKEQLDDDATRVNTEHILAWCLIQTLTLLHPFMPFVTEELWGHIYGTDDTSRMLMVSRWPTLNG